MSEKFSCEVKQRAVAEVVLGVASMTKVAERYGMSVGYLSILCSKFRSSFSRDRGKDFSHDGLERRVRGQCLPSPRKLSLASRVSKLEQKVNSIVKLINN